MKLSQEAKYGLEALILLARKPAGTTMLLEDIATAQGLPRFLLAKTFQKLTRHGVLRSFRGAVRGYSLARPPKQIDLERILTAIEGPDAFGRCIFWSQYCSDATPCPLHDRWKTISNRATATLMSQTLADLVKQAPGRGRAGKKPRRTAGRSARR